MNKAAAILTDHCNQGTTTMTTADTIRTTAARLFGYQTRGHGFTKVHYSLTLKNALNWAHCYDRATVTRRGQFIASTTTGAKQ